VAAHQLQTPTLRAARSRLLDLGHLLLAARLLVVLAIAAMASALGSTRSANGSCRTSPRVGPEVALTALLAQAAQAQKAVGVLVVEAEALV
jgi:hypothetical protein